MGQFKLGKVREALADLWSDIADHEKGFVENSVERIAGSIESRLIGEQDVKHEVLAQSAEIPEQKQESIFIG